MWSAKIFYILTFHTRQTTWAEKQGKSSHQDYTNQLICINLKKGFQFNALVPESVFSLPPAILTRIKNKNKNNWSLMLKSFKVMIEL